MSNVENSLWRTNVKRAHSVSQLLFVFVPRIWLEVRLLLLSTLPTTNFRVQFLLFSNAGNSQRAAVSVSSRVMPRAIF